ncbi:hypothetical protein C7N43_28185 [Sphingobacteriales bacterium UPWRP_1]|nr:hypothetical protein BVG80_18055 [Sphingobacteriales bacterium TSM_CSM]PSJ73623.1 hypothetical protein C7N43_28185 [Sphingobacteriales bacterium UPWRP_1]
MVKLCLSGIQLAICYNKQSRPVYVGGNGKTNNFLYRFVYRTFEARQKNVLQCTSRQPYCNKAGSMVILRLVFGLQR